MIKSKLMACERLRGGITVCDWLKNLYNIGIKIYAVPDSPGQSASFINLIFQTGITTSVSVSPGPFQKVNGIAPSVLARINPKRKSASKKQQHNTFGFL